MNEQEKEGNMFDQEKDGMEEEQEHAEEKEHNGMEEEEEQEHRNRMHGMEEEQEHVEEDRSKRSTIVGLFYGPLMGNQYIVQGHHGVGGGGQGGCQGQQDFFIVPLSLFDWCANFKSTV